MVKIIPLINTLLTPIEEVSYPSRTYKVVLDKNKPAESENRYRVNGYCDKVEALIQSIYFILSTERYKFVIYSWNYGVELVDLIGKPMPYVMSEIPRRIKEALTQDSRINNVKDFEFEKNGKKLHVTFTVETKIGEIPSELEVAV